MVKIEQDGAVEQFKNLDKCEYKALYQYFSKSGIKMRQLDPDSNKSVELNNVNYEQMDEEIRQSQS